MGYHIGFSAFPAPPSSLSPFFPFSPRFRFPRVRLSPLCAPLPVFLHHPLRSPLGRSPHPLWLRDGAISTDAVRISLVPSCFRTPSFRQMRFRWFILQSKKSLGFSEFPFKKK